MNQLLGYLGALFDLLLVVIGFGLIVFVHELGHFGAAKWAGIRVLAFALGFGPALVSYRKGLGWRRGSSESEYLARLRAGAAVESGRALLPGVSPTEYRLNWLPLGGYVKMLGQDDLDPGAVSSAPDSYQNCRVWKRMVVICAGVVMNVIGAAVLFIGVCMDGLETEPAKIGYVDPAKPAARAIAVGGVVGPGLRAGDTIVSINGRNAQSFNDLMMASAMSGRGETMRVIIERRGLGGPVEFEIVPETSEQTRLMEIGVTPAYSATLLSTRTAAERDEFDRRATELGLAGLEPGMRLVRIGANTDIRGAGDLIDAVRNSGGNPVQMEFQGPQGKRITVSIRPTAQLQTGLIGMPSGSMTPVSHLLGLAPVMRVDPRSGPLIPAPQQGLKEGDVLALVGDVEFPSTAQGMAEIHRNRGKHIPVTVLRTGAEGSERVRITPDPEVKRTGKGQIGFLAGDTRDDSTLVALPPTAIIDRTAGGEPHPVAAARIITRPGSRIVSIAGAPVANFSEIRAALRAATDEAFKASAPEARIPLVLELPITGGGGTLPTESVEWALSRADLAALHSLGWDSPLDLSSFEPEEILLRAQGSGVAARALDAVGKGLSETQRVMVMTYMTFARLFEGTVKVEHLKGPVGIAHMGTKIADRGLAWLLFFMALISVNLAVVNFLPLPIVDGGQFIFLLLEGIRGKPVSIQVQNIATIAGLILIGTMFLVVTFQDFANLFS